ncbi:tRNA wybutosine-synthesizing protein 4-like [Tubulanus polymorphus]|uniref:tRNA wybutosine-synthesizing protein 4-like n=1 Tax=Tubulanus polymorphus TaxID=672921 RepID=UPI003DA34C3B
MDDTNFNSNIDSSTNSEVLSSRKSANKCKTPKTRNDTAVRGTNDNSILSKCSMANLGYFDDEFLQYFVCKKVRRAPLINRCYFIRSSAIDYSLKTFVKEISGKKQIISLGAGFDSSYFRLKNQGLLKDVIFYEIDFIENAQRKANLIRNCESLNGLIQESEIPVALQPYTGIYCDDYRLLGIDLTQLPLLTSCLTECGINLSIPTLLLSECVMTYMGHKRASSLIQWASDMFPDAVFVTYEQIFPYDTFSNIMCNHFKKFGSPLRSITVYPNPQDQIQRYKKLGWNEAVSIDMNQFYHCFVSDDDKRRTKSLEIFDEFEEWHLTNNHYSILFASRGSACDIRGLFKIGCQPVEPMKFPESVPRIEIKPGSFSADAVLRFGHATVTLGNDAVMVTGGFGDVRGKHQKIRDTVVFDVKGLNNITVESTTADILGVRLFHTMNSIDENQLIIFGGRTSPTHPLDDLIICEHSTSRDRTTVHLNYTSISSSTTTGETCTARWRHTSNIVRIEGEICLLIYGGCGEKQSVLNTCYLFNISTSHWKKIELKCADAADEDVHLPGLHSHTSSLYNDDKLIIVGGLNSDLRPTNAIYTLQTTSWIWSKLSTNGHLIPRYSHSTHVYEDKLLIVGGVTVEHYPPPGVAIVDLKSGFVHEFPLPSYSPEHPLLLHNHRSLILTGADGNNSTTTAAAATRAPVPPAGAAAPVPPAGAAAPVPPAGPPAGAPPTAAADQLKLLVIGGGGNCFTFGTHFNQTPVYLDVTRCWQFYGNHGS